MTDRAVNQSSGVAATDESKQSIRCGWLRVPLSLSCLSQVEVYDWLVSVIIRTEATEIAANELVV